MIIKQNRWLLLLQFYWLSSANRSEHKQRQRNDFIWKPFWTRFIDCFACNLNVSKKCRLLYSIGKKTWKRFMGNKMKFICIWKMYGLVIIIVISRTSAASASFMFIIYNDWMSMLDDNLSLSQYTSHSRILETWRSWLGVCYCGSPFYALFSHRFHSDFVCVT